LRCQQEKARQGRWPAWQSSCGCASSRYRSIRHGGSDQDSDVKVKRQGWSKLVQHSLFDFHIIVGTGIAVAAKHKSAKGPAATSAANPRSSRDYLTSTLAPASSSCFLRASASAFGMASLTGFGAPSTRSLASLRPRPVAARTTLIASTFLSPAASRTTVNSVFSSAAAAAPPAAGAATATAAAGGNAELLFHFLDQFGQFENGHVRDGVEDFLLC
jgi:hypothetical protein